MFFQKNKIILNPKISVITVCYNSEALLERTILSVLNQTYDNIEYIIVDGASKDGTLDIIKKYDSQIAKWISEKDKGLYDAMNKGLQLATGDFVWFMNSGDSILENDTVEKMVAQCESDTDILFGEVMMVDDDRNPQGTRSEITTQKLPVELTWKSLQMGMVVCHQAFLPKRKIAPFYIENNLSADIDWVIKCLKASRKNTNTQLVLAEYLMGGASKQKHQEGLWGRFDILKKHYGLVPNIFNHIKITFRAIGSKLTGKTKY